MSSLVGTALCHELPQPEPDALHRRQPHIIVPRRPNEPLGPGYCEYIPQKAPGYGRVFYYVLDLPLSHWEDVCHGRKGGLLRQLQGVCAAVGNKVVWSGGPSIMNEACLIDVVVQEIGRRKDFPVATNDCVLRALECFGPDRKRPEICVSVKLSGKGRALMEMLLGATARG